MERSVGCNAWEDAQMMCTGERELAVVDCFNYAGVCVCVCPRLSMYTLRP